MAANKFWTQEPFFLIKFLKMFIYFWETETECEPGRVREREGDTASKAGSRLWAVSTEPNMGLELMDCEVMTWAEVGRPTDWATQAPQDFGFQKQVNKKQY